MENWTPVHEFEAWSTPGKILPMDYGKDLQREFLTCGILESLSIPDDVFLGVSEIPDEIDVHNLKLDFEEGLLSLEMFYDFCHKHGLEANVESKDSAAKYREYSFGRCLAWIHIQEGYEQQMLPSIVALMKERGHIVRDPATSEQVF
jgi:hypothetical protein